MHVVAVIEQVPEDNTGTGQQQVDELSAEVERYEDAVTEQPFRIQSGRRFVNLRRT